MGTLFWVLIGAFIGWNFPQPWWAQLIQKKIVGIINEKTKK